MRVLCPGCGLHHEVVRVLEDGFGEGRHDVYQVAPLEQCPRTWIADKELFEAQARFGQDALEEGDEEGDDLG